MTSASLTIRTAPPPARGFDGWWVGFDRLALLLEVDVAVEELGGRDLRVPEKVGILPLAGDYKDTMGYLDRVGEVLL